MQQANFNAYAQAGQADNTIYCGVSVENTSYSSGYAVRSRYAAPIYMPHDFGCGEPEGRMCQ